MTEKPYDIAVLGLGVMGLNLSLNFTDKGIRVIASDPLIAPVEASRAVFGARVATANTPEEALVQLSSPRRTLMMVKAGEPTDLLIDRLAKALAPGDILIDGGNTHFRDTQARQEKLARHGIRLVGLGVSGGETGARHGPALMAGGDPEAIDAVSPLLSAIAARTEKGESCYGGFGPGGAGHFVKMAHNGIEYALMQMFAEFFLLLEGPGGIQPAAISTLFSSWNTGPCASYLLEVSAKVLAAVDPETGKPLISMIRDRAAHKGTGQWTAEAGLELGVALPSIAAAFTARVVSSMREQAPTSPRQPLEMNSDCAQLVRDAHAALPLIMLLAYAQGIALIAHASEARGWQTDLAGAARVWRAGCIIRSALLEPIAQALQSDAPDLLASSLARQLMTKGEVPLRRLACAGIGNGIPIPVLAASISYLDGIGAPKVGASLIQGQRDFFGAHTFERVDRPGSFRHDWREF